MNKGSADRRAEVICRSGGANRRQIRLHRKGTTKFRCGPEQSIWKQVSEGRQLFRSLDA